MIRGDPDVVGGGRGEGCDEGGGGGVVSRGVGVVVVPSRGSWMS